MGSTQWKNHKSVEIPPEYRKDPQSYALCIYPTGNLHYEGSPTITLAVIDSYDHSQYDTVLEEVIPQRMAKFKRHVKIDFRYRKGKYIYGSE